MSKKDKKKDTKKNVQMVDKTPEGVAKSALEALSDEQRATVLEELGIPVRKAREKKDMGPTPKELFAAATEKLSSQAFKVCNLMSDFQGGVAVTFERDPEGVYSASVKRVRNKYGPRKSKD